MVHIHIQSNNKLATTLSDQADPDGGSHTARPWLRFSPPHLPPNCNAVAHASYISASKTEYFKRMSHKNITMCCLY